MNAVKAARIMGGIVNDMSEQLVFTGISTDTRSISEGDLFVAIKGENFDGSDYVDMAFKKGAVCALTSANIDDPRVINVKDTIVALGKLAKAHRNQFNIPVIAVTGSVGKTTVKNMMISVFSQKFNVHHTIGNKNNHIGLPMTLFNLNKNHDISILEMGMSDFGEIDYLSYLASPDFALITNIGMSHIGNLGSQKNILKAKSEIMNHMKAGGTVIVNGDDSLLQNLSTPEGITIKKYGLNVENDYIAIEIGLTDEGNCTFISDGTKFELPIPGNHNAVNAMGVVATARLFNIEEELIQKGMLEFNQSKMRMHRFSHNRINYINDAYNANPQSMRAALDILMTASGRKIAVLGDMLEMGDFSQDEHIKIGAYAAKCADILLLCGREAAHMAEGAANSYKKIETHIFENSIKAEVVLRSLVIENDTVLVKGSRGMKMENVLEYTKDGGNG